VITGIGGMELIVIIAAVLLFFGSKELPQFLRQFGTLVGKFRQFTQNMRMQIDSIANEVHRNEPQIHSMDAQKEQLRKKYRAVLANLSTEQIEQASEQLVNKLKQQPAIQQASTVMLYAALPKEVQTRGFIEWLLKEGKTVVMPWVVPASKTMHASVIKSFHNDLAPGPFGILQPRSELQKPVEYTAIDIIICPGLAFDRHGTRLGQGGGYYDRFTAQLLGKVQLWGICFDEQISKMDLPFLPHDTPIDQVFTPQGPLMGQSGPERAA